MTAKKPLPKCVNCRREERPALHQKYGGYCLSCWNAGVPEKDAEIAALRDQIAATSIGRK